jgi:hypothetical protein
MATSKHGVVIPDGQSAMCRLLTTVPTRETTRAYLHSLLKQLRDRVRAVKEAAAASTHVPLTRGRNVVQARLVTDRAMRRSQSAGGRAPHPISRLVQTSSDIGAVDSSPDISRIVTDEDIPVASLKDDLERKQALRRVMGKTETEDRAYPGGDPELAGQKTKEETNYRYSGDPEHQCGSCKHFDGASGCALVAGLISRTYVSDLFESRRAHEALRVFKATLRKYPR